MGPALTLDERRHLTLRGATVFERAALLDAIPSHRWPSDQPSDAVRAAWRAWLQAFSPGDADALERRLAWDGLDVSQLTRALSDDWLPDEVAEWVPVVDEILTSAHALAIERRSLDSEHALRERGLFDGQTPPPFLDLLIPVLRAARCHLRQIAGPSHAALDALAPGAWRSLDRHLLREASGLAELALFDVFRDARRERGLGYDAFVQDTLERGYAPLLLTHAVLARQLACIATRSASATLELLRRLEADRSAIAATFDAGRDPGVVVDVEPGLSDAHAGGRRVSILRFETGLRLVYKPRPVSIESAFSEWLDWAAARGLQPPQRAPRAIDRGEYGWTELVLQETFDSPAQVREYFRRCGGLLCLAHALRARDLHMENIVATRHGPVLVDLELLLQPDTEAWGPDVAGRELCGRESCLASGLLTFVVSRGGRRFDIGGLRGTGRGVAARARRVWRDLDSDALHYTEESTFDVLIANAVVLNGVTQVPDDHADEVLSGFADTYHFLLTHRDELVGNGGGLAVFEGRWTRVVPRATVQYGTLFHVVARPTCQKDGRRWSMAHDALNRAFNRCHERPDVWDVLTEERRALERLDVPFFRVAADGTALRAGDQTIEGHFRQSGLSAVADGLRGLSIADLAIQQGLLARALSQPVTARFLVPPPIEDAGTQQTPVPDESLLAHASWIAREMLERGTGSASGRPTERGAGRWQSCALYDGSIGATLFLAAMAAVAGDAASDAAARQRLSWLRTDLAQVPDDAASIGAASGLGSIVYALTLAGSLLGDAASIDLARTLALAIDEERGVQDGLDVYGGLAGAVLALLALHRISPDEAVLACACRCGDRLVRAVESWLAPGRSTLVGFAHGVAGVAHALGQLHAATGEERFGQGALACWRYVRDRFLVRQGNWPIAASDGGAKEPSTLAWCHGAPGVLLAAAHTHTDLLDVELFDQVDAAIETTMSAPLHVADHVCCGNMGRADALFTVGRRLMRRDAIEAARTVAASLILRARADGHFGLGGGAFDHRVFDPGFFRGVSGIGYTMLRLAAPARLPCVLAFEAPNPRHG